MVLAEIRKLTRDRRTDSFGVIWSLLRFEYVARNRVAEFLWFAFRGDFERAPHDAGRTRIEFDRLRLAVANALRVREARARNADSQSRLAVPNYRDVDARGFALEWETMVAGLSAPRRPSS